MANYLLNMFESATGQKLPSWMKNGADVAPPDLSDELIIRKQLDQKQRLAALQGRSATFLTGPMGIGGPPSELAMSFLRAKANEIPLANLPTTSSTTESPPPPGFTPPPAGPPGQVAPPHWTQGALGALWGGF